MVRGDFDKDSRRRFILRRQLRFGMIGWMVGCVALLAGRGLGLTTTRPADILLFGVVTIGTEVGSHMLVGTRRHLTDGFIRGIFAFEVLKWLAFLGWATVMSRELRLVPPILGLGMLVVFCVTAADFVTTVGLGAAISGTFSASAYIAVTWLHQPGALTRDVFYSSLVLPCSVFVAVIGRDFRRQRAEIRDARREAPT